VIIENALSNRLLRASAPGSPSSAGTAEPQQGSAFVPCALTWIMPEANRLVG